MYPTQIWTQAAWRNRLRMQQAQELRLQGATAELLRPLSSAVNARAQRDE